MPKRKDVCPAQPNRSRYQPYNRDAARALILRYGLNEDHLRNAFEEAEALWYTLFRDLSRPTALEMAKELDRLAVALKQLSAATVDAIALDLGPPKPMAWLLSWRDDLLSKAHHISQAAKISTQKVDGKYPMFVHAIPIKSNAENRVRRHIIQVFSVAVDPRLPWGNIPIEDAKIKAYRDPTKDGTTGGYSGNDLAEFVCSATELVTGRRPSLQAVEAALSRWHRSSSTSDS